jgi:hypothetical protein
MIYLTLIIFFSILAYIYKSKAYSLGAVMTLISVSPIVSAVTSEFIYLLSLLVLSLLVIGRALSLNVFGEKFFTYASLVLFVIFFQLLVNDATLNQIILGLFKLLFIPAIAYSAFFYAKKEHLDVTDIIRPYIILNIAILYYRAFIDYSFFDIIEISDAYYATEGIIKSVFFRPSNLSSPIMFAIELSIYIALLLRQLGLSKGFLIEFSLYIFPLIVMQSRAALAIVAASFICYIFLQRMYKTLFLITIIFFLLFIQFRGEIYFFTVFDIGGEGYLKRFTSMIHALDSMEGYDMIHILLGKGIGASNMIVVDGSYKLYVENFYISFINDMGFVIAAMWFLFTITVIFVTRPNPLIKTALLVLLLTNVFASNFTAFNVQFFYTLLMIILIYDGWPIYRNSRKLQLNCNPLLNKD